MIIIHSLPRLNKRFLFFFFRFFFFFFCKLRRVMTQKFKFTSARRLFTMKFNRLDLFLLSALSEEGWNKRKFDFCSNTRNEEKKNRKIKFFYFFSLIFFFILKIPTKIKSILIPSFLYRRFFFFDRFSVTMMMLRWGCVLHVHGRILCRYLQKMRIFIPRILSLPDFIVLATNNESEWFLFSFFLRDKTHDWMILIECRLLEPIIEKEIKNIRICIIFFFASCSVFSSDFLLTREQQLNRS